MAGEHLYRLQWRLDAYPEGFAASVAKAATEDGFGSCDKAVLITTVDLPDGSATRMLHSTDGLTGEPVSDYELFHTFALLAHRLSTSRELDEGRKQFAALVFHQIREALRTA